MPPGLFWQAAGPGPAGDMDQQEPHGAQQRGLLSPAPTEEKPPPPGHGGDRLAGKQIEMLIEISAENDLVGLSGHQADREAAKHPCSKGGHHHPGLHEANSGCQQVRGDDPSLLLSTGEAHLEQRDQFWVPQHKRHKDLLELVWQKTMKLMKGLEQGDSSGGSAWRRDGSEGSYLCLSIPEGGV